MDSTTGGTLVSKLADLSWVPLADLTGKEYMPPVSDGPRVAVAAFQSSL